jgi:protein-L-isoaspartate(D-aspartate) O-methyltransferase
MDARASLLARLREAVRDERVLHAMAQVPREEFVGPGQRLEAWKNSPLPIGEAQTISQPLVVARMCEALALTGAERVLDVGTGSGYHAAVLARLAQEVISIEVRPELAEVARRNLSASGVENVEVRLGDGALGVPASAPFDAINVAAAAPHIPADLVEQLAPGGRLVAPVGSRRQHLVLLRRDEETGLVSHSALEPVRFVPLV